MTVIQVFTRRGVLIIFRLTTARTCRKNSRVQESPLLGGKGCRWRAEKRFGVRANARFGAVLVSGAVYVHRPTCRALPRHAHTHTHARLLHATPQNSTTQCGLSTRILESVGVLGRTHTAWEQILVCSSFVSVYKSSTQLCTTK